MTACTGHSTEADSVRSYAIRRVNPFLGVTQIIECEHGRALSCNGVLWEILVRASQGVTMSREDSKKNKTYYRFGLWSQNDGLLKRANSPDEDYRELASKCDALIEHTRERLQQLPFELQDDHELWLFDSNNEQPLALLASTISEQALPPPIPKYWSACLGANGLLSQRRFPQAKELETQVQQRAGFNTNSYWIKRQDNGSGIIAAENRTISARNFPVFLLSENWPDSEQEKRVQDYINWISPSLLTLQHLDRSTRTRLEKSLNVQAVSVEHHWHLYPEIVDEKWLKAARVQYRIQKNS